MHSELAAIAKASGWPEYYEAYQIALNTLSRTRWGLGAAATAGHVHHLAIPDLSGQVNGASWALYTQVSAETLVAAMPLFADLLHREPNRISSNRYIFLVAGGSVPKWSDVRKVFGDMGSSLRVSIGAIDAELDREEWRGPLVGALALGAGRSMINLETRVESREGPIQTIRDVLSALAAQQSIELEDRLLIGGGVALCGFRAKLKAIALVDAMGEDSWLYGSAALTRAQESAWGTEAVEYCRQVRDARPVAFEEYVVQPGDILGRIVRARYNITFERLWPTVRAANPDLVDPNRIRAGQRIRLPRI